MRVRRQGAVELLADLAQTPWPLNRSALPDLGKTPLHRPDGAGRLGEISSQAEEGDSPRPSPQPHGPRLVPPPAPWPPMAEKTPLHGPGEAGHTLERVVSKLGGGRGSGPPIFRAPWPPIRSTMAIHRPPPTPWPPGHSHPPSGHHRPWSPSPRPSMAASGKTPQRNTRFPTECPEHLCEHV